MRYSTADLSLISPVNRPNMNAVKRTKRKGRQYPGVLTYGVSSRRETLARWWTGLVIALVVGILLEIIPVREGYSPISSLLILGPGLQAGAMFTAYTLRLGDDWIELNKHGKTKRFAFADVDRLVLDTNSAVVYSGLKKIRIGRPAADPLDAIRELLKRLERYPDVEIVGDRKSYLSVG
jgi:hypothetical protein